MKVIFWFGLIVMVLGIVSLVIPIPRTERHSAKAVGVEIGIETKSEEKVSPVVSAIMILGGAGMMIAGKKKA